MFIQLCHAHHGVQWKESASKACKKSLTIVIEINCSIYALSVTMVPLSDT